MTKSWKVIKKVLISWHENRITTLAAALAYYMLFALVPILLICLNVAGFLFDKMTVREDLLMHFSKVGGSNLAAQLETMITNKYQQTTNVIGIIILLFVATEIFSEIQNGLNAIWGVVSKSKRGFIEVIHDRLLSFIMVIVVSGLFLMSLIFSTLLVFINTHMPSFLSGFNFSQPLLGELFSFFLITTFVAILFKVLPDVIVGWREVWVGAILTTLLFIVGKFVLVFYLTQTQILTVFGIAQSLIALLIWVYYAAQIFFVGAILTRIFSERHAKKLVIRRGAVKDKI